MKKILFFILLIIILTGCSQNNPNKMTEKNAPDDMSGYNEFEILGKMNAIKNGLAPKVKPTGKSTPAQNNEQPAQGQEEKQMPNLTEQFNQAIIKTNLGDITVGFYNQESPVTVNNFLNLAQSGFYNETKFHRVIKDFMIQGGDPNSKDNDWSNDGMGGPGYKFQDEINEHKLVKGSLAMANSGPNTNGSQFFIVTADATSWLDGKHTNFGYVINGMDIIEKIEEAEVNENDHPVSDIIVENIELKNDSAGEENMPMGPEMMEEDSDDSIDLEEDVNDKLSSIEDVDNNEPSSTEDDSMTNSAEENNDETTNSMEENNDKTASQSEDVATDEINKEEKGSFEIPE